MMTTYSQKTSAVISAIRKYDDMRLIVANTPNAIKERYDKLSSPRSAQLDGMPHSRDFQAGETRLAEGIDIIDEIRKRHETASAFLLWFEPMWNALTESERRILETYKYGDVSFCTFGDCAEEANYSTRQLHRKRRKAMSRLEFLLYGE